MPRVVGRIPARRGQSPQHSRIHLVSHLLNAWEGLGIAFGHDKNVALLEATLPRGRNNGGLPMAFTPRTMQGPPRSCNTIAMAC